MQASVHKPCLSRLFLGLALTVSVSGCFVIEKDKTSSGGKSGATGEVLGASLGDHAGVENPPALDAIHAMATTHAPAPVRPDPDLIVRQTLLQYRDTGSTVAREIGRVEQFRMLLGGANATFTVAPQEGYDSTSILAQLKVAEELCKSLVNPNGNDQPGWSSILVADPSDTDTNVKFLMQRMLGIPAARIDATSVADLKSIIDDAKVKGKITRASYVPACATLMLDAEGLLL